MLTPPPPLSLGQGLRTTAVRTDWAIEGKDWAIEGIHLSLPALPCPQVWCCSKKKTSNGNGTTDGNGHSDSDSDSDNAGSLRKVGRTLPPFATPEPCACACAWLHHITRGHNCRPTPTVLLSRRPNRFAGSCSSVRREAKPYSCVSDLEFWERSCCSVVCAPPCGTAMALFPGMSRQGIAEACL